MFLPEPGMPENSGTGTDPDSSAVKPVAYTDTSCSLTLFLISLASWQTTGREAPGKPDLSAGSAYDSTQTRGPGLSDPVEGVWLFLDCRGEPLKDGPFWSLP